MTVGAEDHTLIDLLQKLCQLLPEVAANVEFLLGWIDMVKVEGGYALVVST
jgi:hypothetical protein